MQDLGTLPGDLSSLAAGINNRGQIVGASCTDAACVNPRAFLFQNGVMTDLNTLVSGSKLFLVWAFDINSRGQIVGMNFDNNTQQAHAFLATPCDDESADSQWCQNGAQGKAEVTQRRNVSLPENVRKMLRRQLDHYHKPMREAPVE